MKALRVKQLLNFLLPVAILVELIYYTFHDVPKMIVSGEGFYWQIQSNQDRFWHSMPASLRSFEISSALLGTLTSKAFGLNFSLYNWVWLSTILVLGILLFFLTYVLTGRKLIAFSAALIFSVSYVSQWGLVGWVDTSFIGREPNLLFLIPSFASLHLFLKQYKFKYYLMSIILFFLGIGLGQFGLILSLSYIMYPLFWHLFKYKDDRNLNFFYFLNKRILVSASFLIISVFFVYLHSSSLNAQVKNSYTNFLLHPQTYHYIEKIPVQLANWSNYFNIGKGLHIRSSASNTQSLEYSGDIMSNFSDLKSVKESENTVVIIYILAALVIYFRLPEQRPVLLTVIVATCGALIENIYIGHYVPDIEPGPSRYLYYPTLWLSIFWALFLGAVFWKNKNKVLIVLGLVILGGYYMVNTVLISDGINQMIYGKNSNYSATVSLFTYIENIRPKLEPNTLVITPWDELACGEDEFLNDQIGKKTVIFMPNVNNCAPPGGWEKVALTSSKVIGLTYDVNCKCVKEEKIK